MSGLVREALNKPVTVTWRADSFTIDPPDEWLLDFSHHAEREQVTLAVEAMLGPEQYTRFRASKPKLSDLQVLIGSVFSEFGLDAGEASASTA